QATSIRLSRVLGARSKFAEELRYISKLIARKKAKDKAREKMEEITRMKEEAKSIWSQLNIPNAAKQPKKYEIYKISKLVLEGKTNEAMRLFFTGEAFQNKIENLDVPAEILNNLLEVYEKEPKARENILDFTKSLIAGIVEFSGNDETSIEVAKAVQIMAGLVWIMPEGMRFTSDKDNMVENDRGKSYIDVRKLPEGIIEVKEEKEPGLYWRHIEGVAKIKDVNIMKFAIYNERQFNNASKKVVDYIMLHGGRIISEELKEEIGKGKLSNPHQTFFVNGMLRGSFQPASTGPGHLQIKKVGGKRKGVVDFKKINNGMYLQVNVKYDTAGGMVRVIAQIAKQGEMCFTIPGWRDYMIDLGGYGMEGFDDFSMVVSEEQAQLFDPDYKESDLEKIEEALENKGENDYAPYGALMLKDGPILVKAKEEFPDVVWINISKEHFSDISFQERYEKILFSEKTETFLSNLGVLCDETKKESPIPVMSIPEAEKAVQVEAPEKLESSPAMSLGMTSGIDSFMSDTADCLAGGSGTEQKTDKLIRIQIETLKNIESKEVKELLKTMQKTEHINVELYSGKNPELEVNAEQYEDFGIKKKSLPQGFKMSRKNTITILQVDKGEEFPASPVNDKWARLGFPLKKEENPLEKTIILPVGYNYDHTGLARSIFFGLILSEIAEDERINKESNFVAAALARLMKLYLKQGQPAKDFNLNCEDIVNLAKGDVEAFVSALNKFIKVLPIMPVNVNEQRDIYERAREAWIRA
ncbi:MAG: hypothetical protein ABIH09_05850, partial [Candidatus Omnitrophota bacterium]